MNGTDRWYPTQGGVYRLDPDELPGRGLVSEPDHLAAVAAAKEQGIIEGREIEFNGGWYDKGVSDERERIKNAVMRLVTDRAQSDGDTVVYRADVLAVIDAIETS